MKFASGAVYDSTIMIEIEYRPINYEWYHRCEWCDEGVGRDLLQQEQRIGPGRGGKTKEGTMFWGRAFSFSGWDCVCVLVADVWVLVGETVTVQLIYS